ncbi:unnamed protein product [Mytilus coruscus]|uniref:Uncharacterized protein n=1 Tax=Mytilus coruscus TaxID=42192 RepID=A0A6J8A9D9_MYTCO|nr:unnamed protein product [Mytilus coruscus]
MIDMDPSDLSCIYSTLKFICSQVKSYGVKVIVTFDQPLYWKALTIITNESTTSELQSINLRLGGFHSEMSFLGSIGQLMSGSGLNEVLETVHSTNAVGHMMTGKALARAVRGHLLVDTALNALLVSMTFDIPLPDEEQYLTNEEHVQDRNQSFESNQIAENSTEEQEPVSNSSQDILSVAINLYNQLINEDISVDTICKSGILDDINARIAAKIKGLEVSRTASLWMRYSDMVNILKRSIKAERTGNWEPHLQTLQGMLPHFAAAGHA